MQKKTSSKNAFGEIETTHEDFITIRGFLDYASGDGSYKSNYRGELAETTHVFLCDFNEIVSNAKPTQSRLIVNGCVYDVLMIDNPMGLNRHLEFMLKFNEVVD